MSSKRKSKSFSRAVRRFAKRPGVIRIASLLALLLLTSACASSPESEPLEWKSVVPGRDTVAYAAQPGEPASVVPETDAAFEPDGQVRLEEAGGLRAEPAKASRSAATVLPPSPRAETPEPTPAQTPGPQRGTEPEVTYEAVAVPPALVRDEPSAGTALKNAPTERDELEEVERRARPLPAEPHRVKSPAPETEKLAEERLIPHPDEPETREEEAPLEVVRDPELESAPRIEDAPERSEPAVLPGVEEPVVAPMKAEPFASGESAEWNDSVVARVNGAPILFSELKEYALDQNLPLAGLRLDGTRGQAFRQAMTARVDQTLLVQAATLEDLTANDLDVARRVDAFIAQRIDEAGGRAEFLDMLRDSQLNLDSFRSLLIKRETRRQLATGIVQQRITISSQELEAFKQERKASGQPIEEVQLAQILVACPPREQGTPMGDEMFRKALDLAARAGRQPAAFSKILTDLNRDPTGRTRGGLLGWIDPSTLQPAIQEAVARLHPGEVSTPVATDAGYHVLFMLERRDARDMLYSRKFEEQRNKLIHELRAKAQIEIYSLEGAG